MVSGIFRQLMWNQTIPDEVRGRMAGTELLSYSLGPQLGQVRSSLVAQWTSLRVSIVSGGAACVAGAFVLAAALPSLWRYDERTDENAVRERTLRRDRGGEARHGRTKTRTESVRHGDVHIAQSSDTLVPSMSGAHAGPRPREARTLPLADRFHSTAPQEVRA